MLRDILKKAVESSLTIKDGQEVVLSNDIAKVFGKQHKDVIKAVNGAVVRILLSLGKISEKDFNEGMINKNGKINHQKVSEEFIAKYFAQFETILSQYFLLSHTTSRNKRFSLTRKGFDFVVLSFTGRNADLYKLWYIDAFYNKQKVIEEHNLQDKLNHKDELWIAFREQGKVFRNKLTDSIRKHIVDYRYNIEGKRNDGRYYLNYTKLIYKHLDIVLPKGAEPRDTLDSRLLVRLEDTEHTVSKWIEKYAGEGIHYKNAYKRIKVNLDEMKRIREF